MARGTGTWALRGAFAALALGVLAASAAAPGSEPQAGQRIGRDVMARVEARPRGADEFLRGTWRLIDADGHERTRETRAYWQDQRGRGEGLHSKRLVVFDSPPNLKDTAFLVVSHLAPDADDLRWIYLPALRKVRRVAGSDRGQSFTGTDFAYEDLAERGVDEDEHRWLRSEALEGRPHHVVESTPRAASAYARRVVWVDAEHFTVSRIEFYDPPERLQKVLQARWQQVDGLWFWQRLEMEHLVRRHRTVVETTEVGHDLGLGDEVWSEARLGQGVR
jgi:hypothetical protein